MNVCFYLLHYVFLAFDNVRKFYYLYHMQQLTSRTLRLYSTVGVVTTPS